MAEPARGGQAGGSAQREFDRRRAREAEQRRRMRPLWLAVTVATPFVVYVAARFGIPAAHQAFFDRLASSFDGVAVEPMDPSLAHLLGLLFAFAATVTVARGLWGSRQSTEAWGKGAQGERMTADVLARLPDGYVTVHDLPMPGSRANIDHLVLGPTGVFTVESKHYSAPVVINGKQVRVGGRSGRPLVEQATRQAAAVTRALGVAAVPIVVVHGAGVQRSGWFTKPTVDGVRFCSGRTLREAVTGRPAVLGADEVAALASQARLGLSRPTPRGHQA
jgi:hypothetical protein